ncbi:hypothetical protein [Pseudonocardia sp. HH130630-07]|uniref:hypothetical protein n=1 Tax=Pseudonocardia sp. HH130630-07 TaxID=1690815 RepID=UPI000814C782|nr:hypothetical protein [Pseudonocardia sp. HH130630-07]ANY06216.1 hypothetical protein AFB00_07795 [Pseudonocardia sp. HH130630-07]
MTAATSVAGAARPVTGSNRVAAVLRMNLVDVRDRFGGAWVILAAIFAVNLVIWWAIRVNVDDAGAGTTGAVSAVFFIVGSTYLIAMTQVMPFALSLGITRRHFYTGVCLLLAIETLAHAVLLTALLGIERATGGWGVGMDFFSMTFMPVQNPLLQVLTYWGPLLTIGLVFVAMGAVFRRWGQYGIWAVGLVVLAVLGAVVVGFTLQNAWPAFGRFFVDTPVPLLMAGYPLVIAVIATVGGYLVVRRARV